MLKIEHQFNTLV